MTTIIETHQAALVADPDTNVVILLLPHPDDPSADPPDIFVLLAACAVRMNEDPEWAQELLDWFGATGGFPPNNLN